MPTMTGTNMPGLEEFDDDAEAADGEEEEGDVGVGEEVEEPLDEGHVAAAEGYAVGLQETADFGAGFGLEGDFLAVEELEQVGEVVGDVVDYVEVGGFDGGEGLGLGDGVGKLLGVALADVGDAADKSVDGVLDFGGEGGGQLLAACTDGGGCADACAGGHGGELAGGGDEGAGGGGEGTAGGDVDDGGDLVLEEGFDDVLGGGEVAAGGVELEDDDFSAVFEALFEDALDVALGDGVDVAVDAGDEGVGFLDLGEGEAGEAEEEGDGERQQEGEPPEGEAMGAGFRGVGVAEG